MSRRAFAQAIGSTPAKVGRMEFSQPTADEAAAITAIYGVDGSQTADASADAPPLQRGDPVRFVKPDTDKIVRGTWHFVQYVEVEGDGDDYVEVRGGMGNRESTRCIPPENVRDVKGRRVYDVP